MRAKGWYVIGLMLLAAFLMAGCSDDSSPDGDVTDGDVGDGDDEPDGDDPDGDEEPDGDDPDGDEPDGDMQDGDSEDGDEPDGDEPQPVFGTPRDGQLYAATAMAVITPTEENHPCPFYMGGTGSGRLAEDTHDDLEARVLLLAKDDGYAVVVTLDLIGLVVSDVAKMWASLGELGLAREQVLIHTTHTHTAPDTLGVYGPEFNVSGRCPGYIAFLVETVRRLVEEAIPQLRPVTLLVAQGEIDEPGAPLPKLINDIRLPHVTNDIVTVARFEDGDGATVATLVNWHCHPETMMTLNVYSADFPRWTRKKLEESLGGMALYLSGTVGGMMTSLRMAVPKRTQDGQPVLDGDEVVLVEEESAEKAWSLGYIVGEQVLRILDEAEPMDGELIAGAKTVLLPLENMVFFLGFQMGVLEPWDEMVESEECGFGGCVPQPVHYLHFDRFHMMSIPGELFPEVSVGRPVSSHDWEGTWGVKEYEAISGYREQLPEDHFLMELGLTAGELGYLIPKSDYFPSKHPGYYEEYFSIGTGTVDLLVEVFQEILGQIQ